MLQSLRAQQSQAGASTPAPSTSKSPGKETAPSPLPPPDKSLTYKHLREDLDESETPEGEKPQQQEEASGETKKDQ